MARMASRTTPNLGSQPLRGADFERAHSSVVLGEDVRDRRRGFTIVELLIVVVVIAILAAITIVAYTGINNRAKASAAASAAEQAAKKIFNYATLNSEQYPASLSDAGVSDSGGTTYQYRANSSVSPATFCVTATTQNVSYYASNTTPTPAAGVCAGHVASGQTSLTNLMANPGFELDQLGSLNQMRISATSTAAATRTGSLGVRLSVTNAGYFPRLQHDGLPIAAGRTYTLSAFVRTGSAIQIGYTFGTGQVNSIVAGTGSWQRVSVTTTAVPSGATTLGFWIGFADNTPVGQTLDLDDVMMTEGSTLYAYASGSSEGWAWNGPTNNSTSTGPAL